MRKKEVAMFEKNDLLTAANKSLKDFPYLLHGIRIAEAGSYLTQSGSSYTIRLKDEEGIEVLRVGSADSSMVTPTDAYEAWEDIEEVLVASFGDDLEVLIGLQRGAFGRLEMGFRSTPIVAFFSEEMDD